METVGLSTHFFLGFSPQCTFLAVRNCSLQVLRRTVSMVDDRGPDDLMTDINAEISHRVASSMRLKLGLLSWFCHNMRRRCVMEVVARQGLSSPAFSVQTPSQKSIFTGSDDNLYLHVLTRLLFSRRYVCINDWRNQQL